jgi:hypothetical protein
MSATWVMIALSAVAQTSDELPQRLPPLPEELTAQQTVMPFNPQPAPAPYLPSAVIPPPYSPPTYIPQQQFGIPPPPALYPAPSFAPASNFSQFDIDETTWEEPALPGTRLSFVTLGAGTGFSTTTFDVNHTWLFGYGESPPVNITPGFGMHFWGDGVGLGLPPRVYDVYLDLQCTLWTGDLWNVSVGLTPGLYSDFTQASGDMFQLTGWVIGTRHLTPEWQLVIGAAYVRQLQTTLVPVGGAIWTPHDDLRLELIFPKPKLAMRFQETTEGSLWWYVGWQPGGGAWAVADGANNSALVGYSDWRFVLGVESFRLDGREWSVDVGYVYDRRLTIDNHNVFSPGSTFSVSASLAY